MIRIETHTTGTLINKLIDNIIMGKKIREKSFNMLGNMTLAKMRSIITKRKKRPQGQSEGRLEKAIDIDYFKMPNGVGWGVGNIVLLNRLAPYWYFVDKGISLKGMRIPGRGKTVPLGAFAPGVQSPQKAAFGSGRWHTLGFGWTFRAKVGIRRPLDYSTRTRIWLKSKIGTMMSPRVSNLGGA